ncbi:MBL fold metallo-hydrolase [Dinghuibacter silviterrae]|uniref:Glyoxylase-like metal-dependent hydrolase (Beta-lactamase superfamily II) n=1 Tax=Dinghuibacter silviterrae TaxID=1539049 RepID=A0A4R8DNQ1_9BACT|nr:MBL fold metallo-hydrolase [Dinghuibacter silviterrae]TDW99438.1 glyoxylase-like metal-dependent hydrolase (beta-lactamase superfamily II) [Dinghuibacter silviterrae]
MFTVRVFTFSPLQENTYVLISGREGIVIDPGCYGEEEQEALADFFTQNGVQPKILLQTHCHLDHVFGTRWLAGAYGLTPLMHPLEEKMLQLAPSSGLMWGLPFDNYQGPLAFLEGGAPVSLGDNHLSALFVPGHSPGHLCFYCQAQGFVIGGDALFRESIGRTDLPFGDHATLLQAIRSQLFTLPDSTVVYPGHGPATTIGYEKRHNPFLRLP